MVGVSLRFLKEIKITKVEERPEDAWFDLSLRQLREGRVHFYRVRDFLTGEWLFKVCSDRELGRVMVRALKCPPGRRFAQLEGNTMMFQKSVIEGLLYDVISLAQADEKDQIRRRVVGSMEEIPALVKEHFEIKSYEEATGKRAPGKYWVTLSEEGDEKAMIILFLLERVWPISPTSLEERLKSINLMDLIKGLERAKTEDVYRVAGEQFGLRKEDVDALLVSLERSGQIERPEEGYIKTLK
ncbi:MAG: hypothetical protein AOA65_0183 [Candidatus Bathyarchaeota archaeon BA1]|nr:MAG: hypothetical protein AOA65_0183 [Candidatus Bathyarchaeota archaeon BA1]